MGTDNNFNILIRQKVFSDLLQPEMSKGQIRQIQIVEAAIRCFATVGIEKTTPEKIAQTCKITRPLVLHYFPDVESIFALAVRYIRSHFQEVAIQAIEKAKTPPGKLAAYIESTFDWLKNNPDHVKVWLLFYYYCGLHKSYQKMNSDLVDMGHDRIESLLKWGLQTGDFKVTDTFQTAKMLQNLMTGSLLSAVTETSSARTKSLSANTVKTGLRMVGSNPP